MAYTSLFILMVVAGLKLYTYVMVTFLKKETANPIAKYTGMDVTIAPERVNEFANKATDKLNCAILELRRLFLVENLIESIIFSTRKRRRSSKIAQFNLSVALLANSLTLSGAIVTSIPVYFAIGLAVSFLRNVTITYVYNLSPATTIKMNNEV